MARLLKIVYAGLTIGKDQSDSSYHLTGKYSIDESYDAFAITFEVHVANATRADFLTAEAALRAAYRKQDQALTVALGATNRHSYDPSNNTGFRARAKCTKVGGKRDTANGATFRCSVVVRLPADQTGRDGRREGRVVVDTSPSGRKRVTISGDYTALSSNSAKAQYEAAIATWQASILADISGTFELTANRYEYDEQNKELSFVRVLEEVVLRQGLSATNVASLVSPRLVIRKQTRQLEGSPELNVRPLIGVAVDYETWVDKAETTDLPTLYATTIRPLILAEVYAVASAGAAAIVREQPSFDRTDNRIAVSMDLQLDPGAQFYQGRITVRDAIRHGVVLLPVWDEDRWARDGYQGPGSHVKTFTRTTVGRPGAARGRLGIPPRLPGFVEIEQLRDVDRFDMGTVGDTIPIEAVVHTFVFERANVEGLVEPEGNNVLQLGFTS